MRSQTREVLTHGLVAGLIGYGIVVVFYAVWNVLSGRSPFFTSAVLGNVVFYGGGSPGEMEIWAGPVLAFNGLHLVIFLLAGVVAAWLTTFSEHGRSRWYLIFSLLMYGAIHIVGFVLLLAEPIHVAVPVWSGIFATLLALTGMLVYLLSVHPVLRRTVHDF
ncbi:MAG TPA: hypothetical protein VK966_13155 [Longimicrobiales bacterium]|nr:hypothetical protein [Longimicrobiales bacterium]